MKQETPITKEGLARTQNELDQLVKIEREKIKIEIAEARELGDLKENAEYHSAKEKQSHIEGRIAQLQAIIANALVIDVSTIESETIVFGATIEITNIETEETITYQIVSQDESDTTQKRISYTSPLGKALMGKEIGDTVLVKAPKGDIEYEVQSIDYK